MRNPLKRLWEWATKEKVIDDVRDLEEYLDNQDEEITESGNALSAKLIREKLGSIDASDVGQPKDQMNPELRKNYVRTVAAFYPEVIRDRVMNLISAQESLMARGNDEVIARYPRVSDQIIFGRGTMNGLLLLLEDFEDDFEEYKAGLPKNEPFDKYKLFPELYGERSES